MKTQKHFKWVLWIVSGLILLIGIIQIFSFMPGQLEAMKQAAEQGVAAQQISKFFWQQVIPQLLSYVMCTVAFTGILLSIGVIYEKINCPAIIKVNNQKEQSEENDMDTLFDDFEIVEDDTK